jgi:hypothetical protein
LDTPWRSRQAVRLLANIGVYEGATRQEGDSEPSILTDIRGQRDGENEWAALKYFAFGGRAKPNRRGSQILNQFSVQQKRTVLWANPIFLKMQSKKSYIFAG